jgi:alpha-tubulin suppressor-like RCC1 family protein
MIFSGYSNNIILTENNETYVCGGNYSGQLGLGDKKNRNIYTKLEHNFGKIKNIYCGDYHNIILNEYDELYVCGNNCGGQLGLGDNKDRNTYVKLENNFGKIQNIFCGGFHSIILNDNNGLYACGDNMRGQLGLGDNKNRNTYTKIKHNFGKIKNIYCGDHHNIILTDNNELYVCGYNYYGQLGLGDNNNRNTYTKLEHNFGKIINIYCGDHHNIILIENNELYVCGGNSVGQLGLDDNNTSIYIKLEHNFGIIKNIYCCYYHNIILNDNNEVFVCGYNEYGQLGLGDYENRNIYIKLDLHFNIFNKKPIEHILELNLGEIII